MTTVSLLGSTLLSKLMILPTAPKPRKCIWWKVSSFQFHVSSFQPWDPAPYSFVILSEGEKDPYAADYAELWKGVL